MRIRKEIHLVLWLEDSTFYNMYIFLKLIYTYCIIPINISAEFFLDSNKGLKNSSQWLILLKKSLKIFKK